MKKILCVLSVAFLGALTIQAQVLLSGGLSYSQNFDSLSNSPAATTITWTDNATPGLVGWYASRAFSAGTTSTLGPYAYSTYRIGDGSQNNGWIWSFGTTGNPDRALGSISSGTPKTNAFGVWIQNDTASVVGNILISYTGEQWRNGGNTAAQTLAFSYKIFTSPFSSPLDTVPAGVNSWVGFSGLDFISPTTGATAATLDGNATGNQVLFNNVLLTGVTLNAGEGIFLRWVDIDDSGNDHGFGVDGFSTSFTVVPEPATWAIGGILALVGLAFRSRSRK
jgi:uncharacterized protein